jgi:hypothetical protein
MEQPLIPGELISRETILPTLGLRNAKKTTGIRVRKLHFNASGEGKCCETDGHNTDIKSRRESAMRASEPTACVTPDSEAQAQLHSGGIPGSYPVVIDFNHTSEVKVGSWEGILSFHDFELHENGDVTAWKSTGIGPGKKFTKAELDKKYV